MRCQNQVELFIKRLEELLDAEREIWLEQPHPQHTSSAERYQQAFPAEFDESRTLWESTVRRSGSPRQAVSQMLTD